MRASVCRVGGLLINLLCREHFDSLVCVLSSIIFISNATGFEKSEF